MHDYSVIMITPVNVGYIDNNSLMAVRMRAGTLSTSCLVPWIPSGCVTPVRITKFIWIERNSLLSLWNRTHCPNELHGVITATKMTSKTR